MKSILLIAAIASSCISLKAQSLEWAKQIGAALADEGNSICLDIHGNVYHAGLFTDTVDFDPNLGITNLISTGGNYDPYIEKLDSNGNLIWVKQIRSSIGGFGGENIRSITVDAVGNVYATGSFTGSVDFNPDVVDSFVMTSVLGPRDIFVLKLNSNGEFQWAKQMGEGYDFDEGSDITTDNNGNVYTAGTFRGTVDFDPGINVYNITSGPSIGALNTFIQKLDSNGNFIWAKHNSGTSSILTIGIDISNNIYTSGSFGGVTDFDPNNGNVSLIPVNGNDIFIQKLDNLGNLIWVKQMGGLGEDIGWALSSDINSEFYLVGNYQGTADFDPGPDTNSFTSNGDYDIFISKFDTAGNNIWAKSIGGVSIDQGTSITSDQSGNIFITGAFGSTADCDPGPGTFLVTGTTGSWNGYILALDSAGNFLWATPFGASTSGDGYRGNDIVYYQNSLYSTGSFIGTIDFDPGTNVFNLTSASTPEVDIFINKISLPANTGILQKKLESQITVFPNPGSDRITVENKDQGVTHLTILTISGTVVKEYHVLNEATFDISELAQGFYILKVENNYGATVGKLIKQ